MAWLGRNFVRLREEEAAIETLKQAGATIYIRSGDGVQNHPATPYFAEEPDWDRVPSFTSRILGWSGRAPVRQVDLSPGDSDPEQFERALATLAQFPELEALGLGGPEVTDATLKSLPELPGLKTLALTESSVTAQGLANARPSSRLRELSLFREGRPADAIAGAASLPELRWVQLVDMPVSRADLSVVASMPKLDTLRLIAVRPSEPDAYAPLAEANRLRELTIQRGLFGDADVASIAELPSLRRLWFDHNDLSDDGLARLGSLKRLRSLGVSEPVTQDAARAFAEAHPKVNVTHRSGDAMRYFRGSDEISLALATKLNEAAAAAPDGAEAP
jgi:hypothetical protein